MKISIVMFGVVVGLLISNLAYAEGYTVLKGFQGSFMNCYEVTTDSGKSSSVCVQN
jgi:hypothetical protein